MLVAGDQRVQGDLGQDGEFGAAGFGIGEALPQPRLTVGSEEHVADERYSHRQNDVARLAFRCWSRNLSTAL